ncbi:aldo/keto reductase [Selenihalanaerobacter shriftii]|uniref:4Fe-4S ferredoxin-type domain-containing protein n=1 Tax=Selenihalanaerobacter shriftii TaxID=142842 RepID=A0A1T4JKC3_9FIRM|nr:aldo/keto reductase [Selenihalanaerobacter shriftii]SJZ30563.1 hypothetical protein SAMN02745118_00084 [Selenihalanaerobacter shriftii]
MKYRNFKGLDWEVSALGFGTMRLPQGDEGDIDEEKAIEMIRYGIDQGINYVDTAWPYHGGESENLVGKALQDGYREKVKVATKLPSWMIKSKADLDEYLDKQLEKLNVDKIDFYLLHTLNRKFWDNYKQLDVDIFEWLEKVRDEGKIDYIGFSFHDDYELFEEIIDAYDWDFCQIQYNYIDTEFQAGKKGLKYADSKDIPVIVMEPLRGGSLAGEMPEDIQSIFDQAETKRTSADWALQWLWNQPEVTMVLSGMSELSHVKENIESANKSEINKLTEEEIELVKKLAKKYKELSPVSCTGCGYCIPCPTKVSIPRIFSLYNEAHAFDLFEEKRKEYKRIKDDQRASACVSCTKCEELCPQGIPISEALVDVDEYFNS